MTDATTDARGDARGAGDVLLQLAALLADTVPHLERAGGGGAERLLELVRGGIQALEAAASQLADPVGSPRARDPEAMRLWLHDLRTPVTAIAGSVRMLGEVPREATRIRATDAIERNAKLLTGVLAHRP